MIDVEKFVGVMKSVGVEFFTGVPDSLPGHTRLRRPSWRRRDEGSRHSPDSPEVQPQDRHAYPARPRMRYRICVANDCACWLCGGIAAGNVRQNGLAK